MVTPEMRQHLRGTTPLPVRDCAQANTRPALRAVGTHEANNGVLCGQPLLVLGLAGVGKSNWIRERVAELEQAGKNVVIVAKPHNAAMVAGGDTCGHSVWTHVREGGTGADTVRVDELSMLDDALLQGLNQLARRDPPVQVILSGGFNQYELSSTTSGVRQ